MRSSTSSRRHHLDDRYAQLCEIPQTLDSDERGCPVKVLDGQRKPRNEGGKFIHQKTALSPFLGSQNLTIPRICDGGTASRYFSQFQTDQQTLDWLVTLVTPKDGTTLILG